MFPSLPATLRRTLAVMAAASATILATPAQATSLSQNPITQDQITPSVGFYFSVPLGGKDRRAWHDRAEFGFAMRANMAGTDITGRALPVMHRDLAAIRFNQHGLDRMSLSGQDYYFTDEGISLYADGRDTGKDGNNNWLIYVGVGALALVGIAALSGKEVVDNICNDNC